MKSQSENTEQVCVLIFATIGCVAGIAMLVTDEDPATKERVIYWIMTIGCGLWALSALVSLLDGD